MRSKHVGCLTSCASWAPPRLVPKLMAQSRKVLLRTGVSVQYTRGALVPVRDLGSLTRGLRSLGPERTNAR